MNRLWGLLVLISTLVIADQVTKGIIQANFMLGESIPVVNGLFSITYVQNTGAAWGIGREFEGITRAISLLILPTLLSIYLFWWMLKTLKGPMHISLALSLIFSGAVGNLIDRFYLKYVVDFLDFYYKNSHFPAFNIADSCVSIGGTLLFIELAFLEQRRTKQNASNT